MTTSGPDLYRRIGLEPQSSPSAAIDQPVPSLVTPNSSSQTELWPEPLSTPGLVPRHLKKSATASFPVLEILQRLLYRLRPQGTSGGDLEKALALIGLYQAVRPLYKHLKDFVFWAFTVQITVPESDSVSRDILAWMGSEIVNKSRTRSAMLITGNNNNMNGVFLNQIRFPGAAGGDRVENEVLCLPPIGTRIFWVGLRPFLFSRTGGQSYHPHNNLMSGNLVDEQGRLQNSLTITTFGWSLKPLQAFTAMCHKFKAKDLTGTTTVYYAGGSSDPYGGGGNWQSVSKAVRKLDTIDMDETVKSDLIKDAEYYYSETSRQFFADCGIPYRRGYLFWGPPGTGKSSFSAALAGHLKCDIYHINLASGEIGDSGLHQLFLTLPRKCVVVIEDIDSAGIGREHGSSKPKEDPLAALIAGAGLPHGPLPPLPPMPKMYEGKSEKRNTVTLSGLLNAIDGNASAEGRLLIMTSNNPEALDDALTRPGRIDKKVFFGPMSKAAGRSIFMRLIGRAALRHDSVFTLKEIEGYATDFAKKVPADTFTPAQVQHFLQGCRGDPHKALRDIDAWVKETLESSEKDASQESEPSSSIVSVPAEVEELSAVEND